MCCKSWERFTHEAFKAYKLDGSWGVLPIDTASMVDHAYREQKLHERESEWVTLGIKPVSRNAQMLHMSDLSHLTRSVFRQSLLMCGADWLFELLVIPFAKYGSTLVEHHLELFPETAKQCLPSASPKTVTSL